jgi:hypothetical protein
MDISIKAEFAPRASQYSRGSDVPARNTDVEFTGVLTPAGKLLSVVSARLTPTVK